MAIHVTCPSCNKQVGLPDQFAGRKVRCKKCKAEFIAEAEKREAPLEIVRRRADEEEYASRARNYRNRG